MIKIIINKLIFNSNNSKNNNLSIKNVYKAPLNF